jgi:hypothetical protein
MKTISTALRDFADGLSRGFSLFLTERNDFTEYSVSPRIPSLPKRHSNR